MANGWSIKNWSFHLLRLVTKRQNFFQNHRRECGRVVKPQIKKKKKNAFTLVAKSSRRNRLFPYSPCLYSHGLLLPTFPTSHPDFMSNEPALTCHIHPWFMVSIKVHSVVTHSVDVDKYLMTFSCRYSITPKSFIALKIS